MSQKHRDILIKKRLKLVQGVKVTEDLLSCLMQDYTLTIDMKEEVEAERISSKKVGTLLDNLMRREDTAFDRFVFALVETNQDGMAQLLDENSAEAYIATRNASRRTNNHASDTPSAAQIPMPATSSLEVQQLISMFMSAATTAAANQMGIALSSSSSSGSVVAQPHDGIGNEDTVDNKLEEDRALAIINGHSATKEMKFTVRPATNLHLINHHQVYPMNYGLTRGRVLIINNHYFLDSQLASRHGAGYDRKNLKELFEKLSFTVEIHDNQSTDQMRTLFEAECTNPDHGKASMFILFILSHGSQGNVYGSDGAKLSIEDDITSCFTPEKAPLLAGKPKVFFIQACQGEIKGRLYGSDSHENEAVSEKDEEVTKQMGDLKIEDKKGFVPGYFKKSDVVMSYATVKGYLAWRHTDFGSWFVRCLVHVFSQRAHSEHLLDMLTEVNSLLSKLKTEESCGQLAEKSDTLTKKLYLFPGADPRTSCSVPK